jgi:hypothetical protein
MTRPRFPTVFVLATVSTMAISGCSALSGSGLSSACIDAISDYVGSEATITENLQTPGGSIDLRGDFDGGTFACAGSTDSDEVLQALVYYDDGRVETVIV